LARYIELAPLGRRFLALLLDGVLLTLIYVIASNTDFRYGFSFSWVARGTGSIVVWRYFLSLLFAQIPTFIYFLVLETVTNGLTLGKSVMGVRVAENGQPASRKACLIRNVVRLVDYLPVSYLVGILSVSVDRKMRRVGDIVAGTVVVRWPIRERPNPSPAPRTVYPSSTKVPRKASSPSKTRSPPT